ncbi:GNAT family N-acetyltransferase [Candidatus Poriferisocius sp.]|uniref:GNAT family N-acetyltransferase n=1 Tax=Candidatus Poriferisocius sp. TaxID=3101276 RepID=UPI003B02A7CD
MSPYRGPELLAPDHDVTNFDCDDKALDEWLRRRAPRNQLEGSSRTWVVTEDSRVVAFYASSTAVVARTEATSRAARNQPDPLPAMLLGRLAVDRSHQGKGLAAALLKHFLLKAREVASLTGMRIVLVHARDNEAAEFYRHFGFDPSPVDSLTLMLLVKDIKP